MIRFSSPGLSTIFNEIQSSDRNCILDLGEVRPETFKYFSSLNCKFHFENLRELIVNRSDISETEFSKNLEQYLTEYQTETKFTVILLWDFVNFLSIDELVILFDRLKPFCKENAFVHYLTYIKKTIPARPSRFQISSHDCIEIELDENLVEKNDAITTLSLVKNLSHFIAETNHFADGNMRTGIVENTLHYVPHLENKQKNLIKKKYSVRTQDNSDDNNFSGKFEKVEHSSPGLMYVIEQVKTHSNSKVLNLGGDIKENNNFLLQHVDNIFPENFSSSLKKNNIGYELRLQRQDLIYDSDIKFDAVLIWDIFNFITISDIQKISGRLLNFCKPGTLIYIINYSGDEKPIAPQSFYIKSDGNIIFKRQQHSKSELESLSSVTLLRALKNTTIKKSFLLKEGMAKGLYEYVFECL